MFSLLRKKAKGFTLIELLIVVAIIGILAAIAIPNLLQAQRRSKNSRAQTDTKQIVTQTQLYINDNNTMPVASPPMPFLLWNKGAPGQTVYMAATYDPWGSSPTTSYGYHAAGTVLTGEVISYSIGASTTGDCPIGGGPPVCSGGGIGYSNISGSIQ